MGARYLEPWEMDGVDGIEVVVARTTKAVWTEDDDVFVYTGDTTERADGYIHIGVLTWEDTDDTDDPADDGEYNIRRLRDFVAEWIKANGGVR